MARDDTTIDVYNQRARQYADIPANTDDDATLTAFLKHIPAGGRILDFGCGPGEQAAAMSSQGFAVTASDASSAMVEIARQQPGVEVVQATFEQLDDIGVYDGIWANFSLLHSPKADLPSHLNRVAKALKPEGIFHIAVKVGIGEIRDKLGRFYSYYSSEELLNLLQDAGFRKLEELTGEGTGLAGDVSPWVSMIARVDRSDGH